MAFSVNLVVDGVFGTKTKKALQQWLKHKGWYTGVIDGSIGPLTIKGIQKWGRAKGYYPASKYVIDGVMGPATWKSANNCVGIFLGGTILDSPVVKLSNSWDYQITRCLQLFLNWQT